MVNTPRAPRRSWPGWRRWPNTGTKIPPRSCGVGSVVGDANASANADIGREARVPTAASPCEDAGRPVMATHMTSDPLDDSRAVGTLRRAEVTDSQTFTPGPTLNTVRKADGRVLKISSGPL